MDEMRYETPTSVNAAVKLLAGAQGVAKVLNGGTDLLVQMRADMVTPSLIVDIKKIADMKVIKKEKGGWRIGASVSGAEMGEHPELSKIWPGVVEATELIGSTQVQGRATMVGNLCNASPGQTLESSGCSPSSAPLTDAPMRKPPFSFLITFMSAIFLISTIRLGVTMSARIWISRSVPPFSTLATPWAPASNLTAAFTEVGVSYLMSSMWGSALPL